MAFPILAALSTAAGIYGALKGGGSKPSTTPTTPKDLQGMRGQQIGLLNYLLGMGPDPRQQPLAASPLGVGKAQELEAVMKANPWLAKRLSNAKVNGAGRDVWMPQTAQAPQVPQAPGMLDRGGYPSAAPWVPRFAEGGMAMGPGMVEGPGGPTDDAVPAMLSDGEGVLTAEAVQNLGGESTIAKINEVFGGPNGAEAGQMIQQLLNSLGGEGPEMEDEEDDGLPPEMKCGGVARMAGGGVATRNGIQPDLGIPQYNLTGQMPSAASLGLPAQPPPQDITGSSQYQGAIQPVSRAPLGDSVGSSPTFDPPSGAPQVQTPQQRLESFYGPMGMYASPLQQQSSGAISQYMNQMSPEQRAMNVSQPQLEQNINGGSPATQNAINSIMGLTTGPSANVTQGLSNAGQRPQTGWAGGDQILQQLASGQTGSTIGRSGDVAAQGGFGGGSAAQGILQALAGQNSGEAITRALQPMFQQGLAQANMTGGRFGSANALQREAALNNYNMNASNAMQRGVDQQIAAGSALGNIDLGFNTNQLGARGQDTQAAIASANNRLAGNTTGLNAQLSALGLAQTGQQGLDDATIRALSSLGGLQAQGQQQAGTNFGTAGQLGIGNAGVQNTAAGILGQLGASAGGGDRATLGLGAGQGNIETAQGYTGQMNTINLLQQLLGQAQGASIGGPVIQNQPAGQDWTQIAQILGGNRAQQPTTNAMPPAPTWPTPPPNSVIPRISP